MTKLNNLLIITSFFISLGGLANTATPPPPAPTIAHLANGASCNDYSNQMSNYLQQFNGDNDFYNSVWFLSFAKTNSYDGFVSNCTNGVCTNYFGVTENLNGSDRGCFIATTASDSAKQSLLVYLQQAYNIAIAHQAIGNQVSSRGYGLYGPSNSCQGQNNFAGCNLYK